MIEIGLTLPMSLGQIFVLHFLSKPVPGSNMHSLFYRASRADLLCHFTHTKLAKGSSVCLLQGSASARLNCHLVEASNAMAQDELSLLYRIWGKQIARSGSLAGMLVLQGPLEDSAHYHTHHHRHLGPHSLSHAPGDVGKYVMLRSLDRCCLPTFGRDGGSCFTTKAGENWNLASCEYTCFCCWKECLNH